MSVGIHIADIGTLFEITITENKIPLDISAATLLVLYFKKPDKTVITKTPVFVTNGTDGKIKYTTITGDLDKKGRWKVQAKVQLPSGTWHSQIGEFEVYDNL